MSEVGKKRIISCKNVCKIEVPKYSRHNKKPGIIETRILSGKLSSGTKTCSYSYECTLGESDCSILELYKKFGEHGHIYTDPNILGQDNAFTHEPRGIVLNSELKNNKS
jgi:hypothetical protein